MHVQSALNNRKSACGAPYDDFHKTVFTRADVSCHKCKKSLEYKKLPVAKTKK